MTNRIAAFLALLIVVALLFDGLFRDGQATLFLARKFLELIDYVEFWH